jgi:hypothetical protein
MEKQAEVNRKGCRLLLTGALVAALAAPVVARAEGVTVYEQDDKYVKIGGRIMVQYHQVDPDGGEDTDELFFRRLRPYIEGSVHKDWKGKFQWDMGKASGADETAIKDAYLQYQGFKIMTMTLGNANAPFSRELLTSSKYQQLVERTFVGDHNYGTPSRSLGLHFAGGLMDKKLTWGAAFTSASIDPDATKLDFDSPVNKDGDFNEGWLYGGRVDFHPFGYTKFSQGDFERDRLGATIGIAAFGWSNDDDNNTFTTAGVNTNPAKPDVDGVTGFEVSGALRFAGFSVDAEYNLFNSETVDPTVTSGIYRDGETDLKNFTIEGGYMVIPNKVELVSAWEMQDADNYAEEWTRTTVGANYFFKKHDIKMQLAYRMGENIDGVKDLDADELFLQAQYVF